VTIINTRRNGTDERRVEVRVNDTSYVIGNNEADGSNSGGTISNSRNADLTSRRPTSKSHGVADANGHERMQPTNQYRSPANPPTAIDSPVITKSMSTTAIHRSQTGTTAPINAHHSMSSPIGHHNSTAIPNQQHHFINTPTHHGHDPTKKHSVNSNSSLPLNKHHSTSTLEVLQRSAHSKSSGK